MFWIAINPSNEKSPITSLCWGTSYPEKQTTSLFAKRICCSFSPALVNSHAQDNNFFLTKSPTHSAPFWHLWLILASLWFISSTSHSLTIIAYHFCWLLNELTSAFKFNLIFTVIRIKLFKNTEKRTMRQNFNLHYYLIY